MKTFQTKYGIFKTFNNDQNYIEIFEKNQIPNIDVIEFLRSYISESYLIIDIGSSIGIRPVLYTKINSAINVYCFEPRENLFCLLNKNLAENNISNTVLMNNMIGHVVGTMKIPSLERVVCDHNDIIELGNGSISGSEYDPIHFITLDSLRLLSCDLIFIDLKGLDYLVILGGLNTIKKFKPKICFRLSQIDNDEIFKFLGISKDKNKSTIDLLEKMEYSIKKINDDFILAIPITKEINLSQIKINPVKINPNFIPIIHPNNTEEIENIEDVIKALTKAHIEAKEKIEEEEKAYTLAIEKAYSKAYLQVYEEALSQAKTEAQAKALAHAEAEVQEKAQLNAKELALSKAKTELEAKELALAKLQLQAKIEKEEKMQLNKLGYQFI
jgi:FkbM family methyltransferase